MERVKKLAEDTRQQLKLKYDSKSIKFLEGFIERVKKNFGKEEREGLITSCGAFLGETIIKNYGGEWGKDSNGVTCVKFDNKNVAYPFAKVEKQFENGLEDSVYSFFSVIPSVFEIKKKKWWRFSW
ncbi:hypothetical protein [uncultured Tenacibaculum sp.]|uniref:hypothetical protein n=1 Tax=uncultured Tenacibaculum sp. TaxID=174713 RepID=UPI002624B7FC|nr:hypothetical protein [uncultured Tenacibaculum sp.]